jgi:hypothetical protein
MKKKLAAFAAALAVTAGGVTATTALPASADDTLCMTTENAPFYAGRDNSGGTNYLFTLSAGRGFRYNHNGAFDIYYRFWISGHGAEHPDVEGWVLASHTNCS